MQSARAPGSTWQACAPQAMKFVALGEDLGYSLALDTLVPLWHDPAIMSETGIQCSLTRAASISRRRGKKQIQSHNLESE
jgi:hypothetical protein